MKKNARSAFNALKKIGAPVYEGGDWGGEYFIVSAEENYDCVWADYWCENHVEVGGRGEFKDPLLDDFGVNIDINKILDEYGLFGEWINPGVLGVYDG
jgi:hypothetical protein